MHLGHVTTNYKHPLKVSNKMYHYSKKYNLFSTEWFDLQARTRWGSLWNANIIARKKKLIVKWAK